MEIKYEIYIAAKPEEVWKILVSKEESGKIFHGCGIESDFKIGSKYAYIGPGIAGDRTSHVEGKILEIIPNQLLSTSMVVGSVYGAHYADFESRTIYKLEAFGKLTRLILINDQIKEGDPSYQRSADGGWARVLSSIKSLAETGKPLELPMD
ncbi:SRPBCC domain-containing protein [Leptospira semungkisensis]|uniref:SRPBCC domain-containing protein n=1 Tax=Leptospira semungkisensis TaxID=2484985 RepID=UPI001FE9555B|nr:SRPBCC domain-containing protein [Leptospira semungkisensis]